MKRILPGFLTAAVLSLAVLGNAYLTSPATAQPPDETARLQEAVKKLAAENAELKAAAAKQQPAPMPPAAGKGINAKTGKPFPRGLKPTPKPVLNAAAQFRPTAPVVPTQYAVVPSKLDMWGNDTYGDCVTAEEAYKCACSGVFISQAQVISWARSNGVLNGADLQPVIQQMQSKGFSQDGNIYGDGKESVVDYSNPAMLRAAIAQGVVKLGIDANALPSGAGNEQGWYAFGGRPGQYNNEDHCTGLSGYGTAKFCFDSLHLPLPSGVDPNKPDCYIHFTWSTDGVVDHDWIMSTVGEAWVRSPGTVTVGTGTPTPDPPLDPPAPATVSVPSLLGGNFAAAKASCAAVGLSCDLASGDPAMPVNSQTPAAGTQVASGSTVTVTTGVKPPDPPDPSGDIVVRIPAGSAAGNYTAISVADAAALRAKLDEINAILNGGSSPDRPPPIRVPDGWEDDAAIMGQLGKAMAGQGLEAGKFKALGEQGGHPVLARMIYRKMRTDPEGQKLIRKYKAGALPAGWLQQLLDYLIKNGPAILDLVMKIIALFSGACVLPWGFRRIRRQHRDLVL